MANKNFSKLSSRNQSALVSQLHKLICYYSSIFCTRERVYIKNLAKTDGNVYWLEDDNKNLMAVALLDPKYVFTALGIDFLTLGHTISNKSGQMERLLHHLFSDHDNRSLILLCKSFVAESLNFKEYKLVQFNPVELETIFPELSEITTDYFNVKNERLNQGMARKEHLAYIKFSDEDLKLIKNKKPSLYKFVLNQIKA